MPHFLVHVDIIEPTNLAASFFVRSKDRFFIRYRVIVDRGDSVDEILNGTR